MRLALVGDVMLGRLVNAHLRERPPESVWGNTLRVLQAADLRVCNLECVLSDGGQPWSATPKVFHFRSDTRNVAVLRAAGIDFVSLANNHTLDYGAVALAEMLALLDHEGIQHAGAGRCLEEAAQPAVIQTPEGTVGMVAFTDNQPEWEATSKQAGVLYVPVDLADPRAVRLSEWVRQAREQVDLLIVSAHWGPNWGDGPPPEQAPFAHALIHAGADLIFGHSGHIVRGVELYRERPILYCAGEFIDDYRVDPVERNDESGIFVLQMLPKSQQRLLGLRL
jgi:poly-gamma-glutamate synthesis protein (capsule biosynthesis protein)